MFSLDYSEFHSPFNEEYTDNILSWIHILVVGDQKVLAGNAQSGNGILVPKYYVCSRCSYHWKPRKTDSIPRNCPSCRSTIWMKPFELKTCARCNYEWGSTSEDPRRCPSCGTYHWNEAPRTYDCLRCSHKWTAKRDWPPKRCPKCRSTSWSIEKKNIKKVDVLESRKISSSVNDDQLVKSILDAYKKGDTCTGIAVKTSIPFSVIYGIIREGYANCSIRI